ncbi:MAG: hypothetical protein ABSA65_19715 [Acidimicrobiales bacterium]|jgi:hypothetical protein
MDCAALLLVVAGFQTLIATLSLADGIEGLEMPDILKGDGRRAEHCVASQPPVVGVASPSQTPSHTNNGP